VVTSEYKLNLLAPAIGDRIIGRGKVVKSSSKSVVALAEVYSVKSEKEKLVGVALATIAKVEQTSL
jgi:acyl-coenzyme A thioesterase PaaI-like protein